MEIPEIGCDVAAGGDDNTAIHVRCGPVSLFHEEVNGQLEPETMARLKELAQYYVEWYNSRLVELPPPEQLRCPRITEFDIPLKIDNDGLGGALSNFLASEGYCVQRIGAGTRALEENEYPNRRSELWFTTAEKARDDQIDLSQLEPETIDELRRQALSVIWSLDSQGRRVIMPKPEMQKKMGRSPDSMDAFNLAHAGFVNDGGDAVPVVITTRQHPLARRRFG